MSLLNAECLLLAHMYVRRAVNNMLLFEFEFDQ